MLAVTVVDAPAASVTDGEPTENETPLPVVEPTDSEYVFVPFVRFVIVTSTDFEMPEIDGTAPKLTLTGSTATDALTAAARFSRPAPTTLGSVTMLAPVT